MNSKFEKTLRRYAYAGVHFLIQYDKIDSCSHVDLCPPNSVTELLLLSILDLDLHNKINVKSLYNMPIS